MTDLMARNLFNALYDTLYTNGFVESIGTFLLDSDVNDQLSKEPIYEMAELHYLAQNLNGSKLHLNKLVRVTLAYFKKSKNIMEGYRRIMQSLPTDNQSGLYPRYVLGNFDNESVNITSILNPPELLYLTQMLNIIQIAIEIDEEDQTLFDKLKNI